MNKSTNLKEIEETCENICLFSRRLISMLRAAKANNFDLYAKEILIDFVFEIVKNIETDIYNIKMNL